MSYKIGRYDESFNYINNFINSLINPNNDRFNYTYYKCVRDYIGNRASNFDSNTNIELLEQFYPSEMIEDVTKNFHNKKMLLRSLVQFLAGIVITVIMLIVVGVKNMIEYL